jgi:hypothetical protein
MPPRKPFEFPIVEDDMDEEVLTAEAAEELELAKAVSDVSAGAVLDRPTIVIDVAPVMSVPADEPKLSAKTLAEMEAGRAALAKYQARMAAMPKDE